MAEPELGLTGEDLRLREQDRNLEVLFPNEFTQEHPWLGNPRFFRDNGGATIPIYRLMHVTHEVEAGSMQTQLGYEFIPRRKLGKTLEWDASPPAQTFRKEGADGFRCIRQSQENPVFPGNLSWWGIDVRSWYQDTEEGGQLLERVTENERWLKFAPDYLASQFQSPYGNKGFSMSFDELLSDYKSSRDDKDGNICLKVGGTLRYRYEICYVVIVCMESDAALRDLPTITGPVPSHPSNPIFDPNGLINDQGIVVKENATPHFTIQSIVRKNANTKTFYDWEQLAFGFYFPKTEKDKLQRLLCGKVEETDVDHKKCTSTRQKGYGGKWVCPNELGLPKCLN